MWVPGEGHVHQALPAALQQVVLRVGTGGLEEGETGAGEWEQEEGEGWWWARRLSWDRQTQSHGDDIDLDIAGTKQVARLKIPPCLDLYGSYGAHADHDHTGDHVPAPCRSSSAVWPVWMSQVGDEFQRDIGKVKYVSLNCQVWVVTAWHPLQDQDYLGIRAAPHLKTGSVV